MKKLFLFATAVLASFSLMAEETVLFDQYTSTTKGDYYKDYTVGGATVTASSTSSISSGSGDYYLSISTTPTSDVTNNYVGLSVAGDYVIKSVSFYLTGNGSNKTIKPALVGFETADYVKKDSADYVSDAVEKTITNKGLANAQWFSYDLSGKNLKSVRLFRSIKTLKVGDAAAANYGTAQTIQVYGIRVEVGAYEKSTDATLASISVGEKALDMASFVDNAGVLEYNFELAKGTTEVPAVTYTLSSKKASALKTDATDVNGSTTIAVTAEDGTTKKTYKINFSVKSTVSTDATLKDIKVNGTTVAGFDPATKAYNLGQFGVYEAINVVATANDESAKSVVVTPDEANKKVTIVVTAEDETTTEEYVLNYTRKAATELAEISDDTTWDWTKTGATSDIKLTDETMPTKTEEYNFADLLASPDASFNAAAIMGQGEYVVRSKKYFQGSQLKFKTSVAGNVVVVFSNTGGSRPYRHIEVNGTLSTEGSAAATEKDKTTQPIAVNAGEVTIKIYIPDAANPQAGNDDVVGYTMGRIYSVSFTKGTASAIDNTEAAVKATKVVRDGQLYIEKNGVLYNAQGAVVR